MSTTEDRWAFEHGPDELGIDVLTSDDGAPLVFLSGEIDAATVPRLQACFDAIAVGRPPVVTVGMGDVTFMDSSGVSALVQLLGRLEGWGGTIVVTDASPAIRRVCDITGLSATAGVTIA